jgi:hypothetical protein
MINVLSHLVIKLSKMFNIPRLLYNKKEDDKINLVNIQCH